MLRNSDLNLEKGLLVPQWFDGSICLVRSAQIENILKSVLNQNTACVVSPLATGT